MQQAPRKEYETENYFLYFSTKTYVVGTQKNRLDETHDKKIIKILHSKILLNHPKSSVTIKTMKKFSLQVLNLNEKAIAWSVCMHVQTFLRLIQN